MFYCIVIILIKFTVGELLFTDSAKRGVNDVLASIFSFQPSKNTKPIYSELSYAISMSKISSHAKMFLNPLQAMTLYI